MALGIGYTAQHNFYKIYQSDIEILEKGLEIWSKLLEQYCLTGKKLITLSTKIS